MNSAVNEQFSICFIHFQAFFNFYRFHVIQGRNMKRNTQHLDYSPIQVIFICSQLFFPWQILITLSIVRSRAAAWFVRFWFRKREKWYWIGSGWCRCCSIAGATAWRRWLLNTDHFILAVTILCA